MENYFSNINLVRLVGKWKWHMLIVLVVAGILGAVFSSPMFITPKYKSTAIVYPSNIAPYSEESETEQMLQWMDSQDIKDSLIERFNLPEHYQVDRNYKYYYTTMMYEYSQNVKIQKTPYEAVRIEVLDKDPKQAADMVNALIEFYNMKIRRIHKEKYDEVVAAYRHAIDQKNIEIAYTRERLHELYSTYGLMEFESTSEQLAKGYLGTVDGPGSRINKNAVNRLKKNFEAHGDELYFLQERMETLMAEYSVSKQFLEDAEFNSKKEFTYTNVVTKPMVADKKAFPVRWLVMLYTLAATFMLSLVAIAIIEKRQSANA